MENIKFIDIKEFREKGYLQEVNRRFFHPIGLALEISFDDEGNETLGGIWDYREDKEGIIYGLADSDIDRKNRFNERKKFIDDEIEKKREVRQKLFGNIIEPID